LSFPVARAERSPPRAQGRNRGEGGWWGGGGGGGGVVVGVSQTTKYWKFTTDAILYTIAFLRILKTLYILLKPD